MAKPLQVDPIWLERIAESLEGIMFGSVQIVVHEGRIVQVDKTERYRFNDSSQIAIGSSQGGMSAKR